MSAARVSPIAALVASRAGGRRVRRRSERRGAERGGWDRNSGNYNGNPGSFADVTGLRGAPTWGATGRARSTTPRLRHPVRRGGRAHLRHPDRRDHRGQLPQLLGQRRSRRRPRRPGRAGRRPARAAGDGRGDRLPRPRLRRLPRRRRRRVPAAPRRHARAAQRPLVRVAGLRAGVVRNASAPPGSWSHHGFVSWAPMVRLPELPGEHLELRSDIVTQAITTVPRAEYQDNPNVPAVVARADRRAVVQVRVLRVVADRAARRSRPRLQSDDRRDDRQRPVPVARRAGAGQCELGDRCRSPTIPRSTGSCVLHQGRHRGRDVRAGRGAARARQPAAAADLGRRRGRRPRADRRRARRPGSLDSVQAQVAPVPASDGRRGHPPRLGHVAVPGRPLRRQLVEQPALPSSTRAGAPTQRRCR
jgi:hypothetical protein